MPAATPDARSNPRQGTAEWQDKRRRILEGAAAVFSRRGFSAGTTKEIAAEVDLSQPAIYHYVGSKGDMLREIALQVDEDMMEALRKGLAASQLPHEQLRAVLVAFTEAVASQRLTFAVFRQETRSLEPDVAKRLSDDERTFIHSVTELVGSVQRSGKLPNGSPPGVLALGILNMCGEVHRWYRPDGRLSATEIAHAYCDLIGLDAS